MFFNQFRLDNLVFEPISFRLFHLDNLVNRSHYSMFRSYESTFTTLVGSLLLR